MKDNEELVRLVTEAVEQISRVLVGKPPPVQGMILAQLTAMWVSHHFVVGSAEEQTKLWDALLKMHIESIRQLIEVE